LNTAVVQRKIRGETCSKRALLHAIGQGRLLTPSQYVYESRSPGKKDTQTSNIDLRVAGEIPRVSRLVQPPKMSKISTRRTCLDSQLWLTIKPNEAPTFSEGGTIAC